jgi:hypothetical protein
MRAAFQAARTCYDRFCLGIITMEKDLCCHYFDYKQIIVKQSHSKRWVVVSSADGQKQVQLRLWWS